MGHPKRHAAIQGPLGLSKQTLGTVSNVPRSVPLVKMTENAT